MEDTRQYYTIEFRWENQLEEAIQNVLQKRKISRNQFVEEALRLLYKRYREGLASFQETSEFLTREDLADKTNAYIRLEKDVYWMLRYLAFTMRRFMAEVVRVALEWYVFVVSVPEPNLLENYYRKKHYSAKIKVPGLVIYAVFRIEEYRYLLTDSLPPFTPHIFDDNTNAELVRVA